MSTDSLGHGDIGKSGLDCCLAIAIKSIEGLGWSIIEEWAQKLIRRFNLKLECRNGDMTGEISALFQYDGVTLRLKKDWMHHWQVFHGDWKPDPHWTGD